MFPPPLLPLLPLRLVAPTVPFWIVFSPSPLHLFHHMDFSSLSSSRNYAPSTMVSTTKRDLDNKNDLYILLDPEKFPTPHLANIEEDYPMFMPPLRSFPAPETPLEPMEFLSRSWSISSVDVARSLQLKSQHSHGSLRALEPGSQHTSLEDPTLCAPFTFASTLTSQMVMDRLMAPGSSSVSLSASLVIFCFHQVKGR